MPLSIRKLLVLFIAAGAGGYAVGEDSFEEALKASTASGSFRLRYEELDQASTTDLLTLRSLIGVNTGTYKNFSALVEVEDVRNVAGIDGPLAYEPETTEIDQAFIQYKTDDVTARIGRQVIALDNHRFIGHVGWRQDRQTFDAARVQFEALEGLKVDLSYLYQRNRIFAEAADAKSSDILINASYKTPIGKAVAYGYLLDDDATGAESNTYGLSLKGAADIGDSATKFVYHLEYASQDIDSVDASTDYSLVEAGVKVSGLTAKLGYEVLGSDDGLASFTTPLATLHKFNGWNDIFLGGSFNPTVLPKGLEDTYISVNGKLAGVAFKVLYNDFSAAEGGESYGSEWGFVAVKSFKNKMSVGLKLASYKEDGFSVDTDRVWFWTAYQF